MKHLFDLDPDVTYLNCGAYSPLLKSVVKAGHDGIDLKIKPYKIVPKKHFFEDVDEVRGLINTLLNGENKDDIAIIPSVSYGMAIVAQNLHRWPSIKEKKDILLIKDEFPNNNYAFERIAQSLTLNIKIIDQPDDVSQYNEAILNHINANTALIVLPHIHWINGYKFDLIAIQKKCRTLGAMIVVDGTQSIGALKLDLKEIRPDALIGGAYKWMMGPYTSAYAYLSEFFHEGVPVEETWMNRLNSDDFANLLNYQPEYRPRAQRYNMGEFSNFINIPMMKAALTQLLAWGPELIQSHDHDISHEAISRLKEAGATILDSSIRANHLFSIQLPKSVDMNLLFEDFDREKIYVSKRKDSIRVSPHLYNDADDFEKLADVIFRRL
jgi:selenocysteine lyase/cysteine desulfurase